MNYLHCFVISCFIYITIPCLHYTHSTQFGIYSKFLRNLKASVSTMENWQLLQRLRYSIST